MMAASGMKLNESITGKAHVNKTKEKLGQSLVWIERTSNETGSQLRGEGCTQSITANNGYERTNDE